MPEGDEQGDQRPGALQHGGRRGPEQEGARPALPRGGPGAVDPRGEREPEALPGEADPVQKQEDAPDDLEEKGSITGRGPSKEGLREAPGRTAQVVDLLPHPDEADGAPTSLVTERTTPPFAVPSSFVRASP